MHKMTTACHLHCWELSSLLPTEDNAGGCCELRDSPPVRVRQLGDDLSEFDDAQLGRGLNRRDELVVQVEAAHWIRQLTKVEFEQTGDRVEVLGDEAVLEQIQRSRLVITSLDPLDVGGDARQSVNSVNNPALFYKFATFCHHLRN